MHLGYVCQEDVVLWQLRRFDVNGVVVVVEVAAGVLSCTRLLRIPANNSPKELYVVSVVRSSTSSPTSSTFTIISTSTAGLSELGATFHVLLREATRLQHAETNHLGEWNWQREEQKDCGL